MAERWDRHRHDLKMEAMVVAQAAPAAAHARNRSQESRARVADSMRRCRSLKTSLYDREWLPEWSFAEVYISTLQFISLLSSAKLV